MSIARPTDRRYRARDREPAELHQQLFRSVGGTAGRTDGDRQQPGLRAAGREIGAPNSTKWVRGRSPAIWKRSPSMGAAHDGIVRAACWNVRSGSSGERRMIDLNALIDEALNLAYHGAGAQENEKLRA